MVRRRLAIFGTLLLGSASGPWSSVWAQQRPFTLIGTVRNSAAAPLSQVQVTVQDAGVSVLTDSSGMFRLVDVDAGDHVLAFVKPGFTPMHVQVRLSVGLPAEVNMGGIVLGGAKVRTITLAAVVNDKASKWPVEGVAVSVGGRVVGYSDSQGRFQDERLAMRDGDLVAFRRIGYQPLVFELWPADGAADVNLAISLTAAPVELGEVVVEGDRAKVLLPWMKDFENHRRLGFGRFLTEDDIVRHATTFRSVNVLSWAGAIVKGDVLLGGEHIELPGMPPGCGPVFFLDGIQYSEETWLSLLDFYPPERLAGVEVYSHPGGIPVEFNATGSECGAVAVWTKR